jgi:hypothetical protein
MGFWGWGIFVLPQDAQDDGLRQPPFDVASLAAQLRGLHPY